MYDAQFELIASRIDKLETMLAYFHDSARGDSVHARELEAELAALERQIEQIGQIASYETMLVDEDG